MVHYDIYLKTVIRCLASSIFVVSVGAGCSITYKPIHATVPTVLNPISKRTVRIDEVKDCRRFVKTSGWAGQPVPHIVFSKDDTPERRARCIEVYHCLPEGETVESVIGDTLVKAFRTQGYRVLKQGDPGYAEAKSVKASVEQLWITRKTGQWMTSLRMDIVVAFKGDIPALSGGQSIRTALFDRAADTSKLPSLTTELNRGLADLAQQVESCLSKAHSSPSSDPQSTLRPDARSASDRLGQLKDLHSNELITDEEYEKRREAILDSL